MQDDYNYAVYADINQLEDRIRGLETRVRNLETCLEPFANVITSAVELRAEKERRSALRKGVNRTWWAFIETMKEHDIAPSLLTAEVKERMKDSGIDISRLEKGYE